MKPASLLLAVALAAGLPFPVLAATLSPFVATYEAYNAGKRAGDATMQLVRTASPLWRVDLVIRGNRGFAGLLGLDIEQSTVFDASNGGLRPLSQGTVRKAAFFGRKSVGSYDWAAGTARWRGDLKEERRQPLPLRDGDMSGLLINLALVRDAAPGRHLNYRFVDGGRVREHAYLVAPEPERVDVGELSYEALRVSRTNGGNDEMILWVASGVPTPIRILQRTDGEDAIDLRLVEYRGTP